MNPVTVRAFNTLRIPLPARHHLETYYDALLAAGGSLTPSPGLIPVSGWRGQRLSDGCPLIQVQIPELYYRVSFEQATEKACSRGFNRDNIVPISEVSMQKEWTLYLHPASH